MLEGYKPIDFSNEFPGPSNMPSPTTPNRVGMSQVAMNILANSSFSNSPISELLSKGLTPEGKAPPRKQSLWGRAIDLLSTPAYLIGNAADSALAGHQLDDNDSILHDTQEILGGIGSGAYRGVKAGIRGGFAGSESAADPKDKKFLDDFMLRSDLHMNPEEAKDPANREKVRKALEGLKKNDFSSSKDPGNLYYYDKKSGQVDVSDDDIDTYLKTRGIEGTVASIVLDPSNFFSGGSKLAGLIKGAKDTAEVPSDIIKGGAEGYKARSSAGVLNEGLPSDVGNSGLGKTPGSYKVLVPKGAVQNKIANPATGELITPPSWFDFPKTPDALTATKSTVTTPVAKNVVDPLDEILGGWAAGSKTIDKIGKDLTPVAKVPAEQTRIVEKLTPDAVGKLTTQILGSFAKGDPSSAIAKLATKYPGIEFPQTTKLVEHLSTLPDVSKRIGNPGEHKKIIGAFQRTFKSDIDALKAPVPVKSAAQIINDSAGSPVNLSNLISGAKPGKIVSRNPTRDNDVVTSTVAKFNSQIIGRARPAGIKKPAAYDAAVSSGRTARYSGSQQVQMWNHITHTLKDVKSPNRFAVANNILRAVEDNFLAKGATPMSGIRVAESSPLRLSQVLDAIGPSAAALSPTLLTRILRGEPRALAELPADVVQKIEEFKAGEALTDSSKVIQGVDATSKNIDDLIKGPLSAGRTDDVITVGSKVASDITRAAGGSDAAASQASKYIKDTYAPKNPIDAAIKAAHLNTTALISHPNVSANVLKQFSSAPAVAKAISRAIQDPPLAALGKRIGIDAHVPEWLGARFNAAYKNADMRPIYLREASSAKSTIAKRAEYLNNLAKRYDLNDADLWNDGLKAAQGALAPVSGSQSEALGKEILEIMENLFGSSGLKKGVSVENTVIGRSQLLMAELNKNLRQFGMGDYKFAKKGDYSNGADWLNSWESWDVKKPLDFLFKMQNVVEHTVREKNMFDEIVGRFGSYKRGGDFTHTVTSHPRLAGIYFGDAAAGQIRQFVKNLSDTKKPSSKVLQNFDKVLSKWKAGVTIYVPSHHIRNMIGDVYFNWLGGVNSSRVYGTALKVMQAQKGRYEGLADLDNLMTPAGLQKAMRGESPTAAGKKTALTMKNGTNVTNDMVYVSAFQKGILPTTRVMEDIPDDAATALDKFKPFGGKVQKAAHTFSEARDHYVRLAHYVDVIKKSGKSFEAATEDAAAAVRKWHPDGMDLTSFEKNTMRRIFPFYSWTRKAYPLIIESLVATPGKVTAYPKANYLLQQLTGTQGESISDPFPYDQLFPDWIREKGIGPIFGSSGSYGIVNPSTPSLDLISQTNHPGRMAMSMLNPAARIPIELATGTDTQTGAPIGGITDTDYVAKQLPGISNIGRATGAFGVSDTTKADSPGGVNIQNLLNMLTAGGYTNTGPYQKSAQFDLRDFLKGQKQ